MISEKEFIVLQYLRVIEMFAVLQDKKDLEVELTEWDIVAFQIVEIEPFNKWSIIVEEKMKEVQATFKKEIYKKSRGHKPSNVEKLMVKINKQFDQIEFNRKLKENVDKEKHKEINKHLKVLSN